MALTQRQERLVTLYLRDAEKGLGQAPESVRARLEAKLRGEVDRRLAERGEEALSEEDVSVVLREIGDPVALGASLSRMRPRRTGLELSTDDCRWLGVCGGVARYFGWSSRLLRAAVVFVGLFTGPFAVMAYLAVYAEMYFTGARGDAARISVWSLVKQILGAVCGLALLRAAEKGALWAGAYGFQRWAGKAVPAVASPWDWILRNDGTLLFWAAVCALPLAVLAGLPLANRWSDSVCRAMQAVLALYAVAVFGGIGVYYAGLIVSVVNTK